MTTLSGPGPIGFTWTLKGEQVYVPLTAFTLTGSAVGFSTPWANVFTGNDANVLLALVQGRYVSGELTATVLPPSIPAVLFTAASAGPNGNDIAVTVTPKPNVAGTDLDSLTVINSNLTVEATQTFSYPGLASAAAAVAAIGSNTAPSDPDTDPPLGTGLVQVVGDPTDATELPDAKSYTLTDTTAEAITTTNAGTTSTLFEVVATQAAPGAGTITVTVSLDPGGSTFTLTATYDSGPGTLTYQSPVGPLPAALAFLIAVAPPAGGFAVPVAGPVPLSGGAAGMTASGTAYTPPPTS